MNRLTMGVNFPPLIEANKMIRGLIFTLCSFTAATAYGELMQCDKASKCRLVCYFPTSLAGTQKLYPTNGVTVDRVRVKLIGADNILYTSQRIDRSGTMPTYHPFESFIFPKNYPCRLSPVEQIDGLADSGGGGSSAEPAATGKN